LWVIGLALGDDEPTGDAVGLDGTDELVGELGGDDDGDTVGLGDVLGLTEGVALCDGCPVLGCSVGLGRDGLELGVVDGLGDGVTAPGDACLDEALTVGDAEPLGAGVNVGVGLWLSLPMTCCSVITCGWLPLISWPTRPTAVSVTPVTSAQDSTQPMIKVSGLPASDLERPDGSGRRRRWLGSDTASVWGRTTPRGVKPVSNLTV
jgi:hypothetical protein